MRILYVVHQFFPDHYTGTERFTLNLAKQMQNFGHYVKVLTYGENSPGFMRKKNFLMKEYSIQNISVISVMYASAPNDLSMAIYNYKMKSLLNEILSNGHFDLIHICHPMYLGLINRVANEKGIPVVLTLTDFWLMCPRAIAVTRNGELCNGPHTGKKCLKECLEPTQESWIKQRLNDAKETLEGSDLIAAPTKFLANSIKKEFGEEVNVVRHGIDYRDIQPNKKLSNNESRIVFGYIGTVIPHKGIHIVVEAARLVANKNIIIKIYGNYFTEVDYYNKLRKVAKDDSRIEFLGEYKDEELTSIMSNVDCVLCPSTWWENSPLTVLTSLAYKIPVITIDVGGAAELVQDGINGFNFKIGDAKSLASILEKIANNPSILNDIKTNIIRPRRVEEEAFEYERIYKKLIERYSSNTTPLNHT